MALLKTFLASFFLVVFFSAPLCAQTQTLMDSDGNLQFDVDAGSSVTSFKMNKDGSFTLPSGNSAPCDAAHAGSMRWNSSLAQFQGCNGTSWNPLASSKILSKKYMTLWTLPAGSYPNLGITKTVTCPSGQMSYCVLVRQDGVITCSSGVSISADGTSCTGYGGCATMTSGGVWDFDYICSTLE